MNVNVTWKFIVFYVQLLCNKNTIILNNAISLVAYKLYLYKNKMQSVE